MGNSISERKDLLVVGPVVVAVRFLAFVIQLSVWCTLGLLVWLAILCRVMLISTAKMTFSLLGNDYSSAAVQYIEYSAAMWPRGLEIIIRAFLHPQELINERGRLSDLIPSLRAIIEIFVASLFYLAAYIIINKYTGIRITFMDNATQLLKSAYDGIIHNRA